MGDIMKDIDKILAGLSAMDAGEREKLLRTAEQALSGRQKQDLSRIAGDPAELSRLIDGVSDAKLREKLRGFLK